MMRERGIGDRLLTGGGIIPPEDMETLAKMGVGRLFGPGASTQDIAKYIRGWFEEQHGAGSVAAAPVPRAAAKARRGAAGPGGRASTHPSRAAAKQRGAATKSRPASPANRPGARGSGAAARRGRPERAGSGASRKRR